MLHFWWSKQVVKTNLEDGLESNTELSTGINFRQHPGPFSFDTRRFCFGKSDIIYFTAQWNFKVMSPVICLSLKFAFGGALATKSKSLKSRSPAKQPPRRSKCQAQAGSRRADRSLSRWSSTPILTRPYAA